MRIENLTQEQLDQILHERREWMDRYYSLYTNVESQVNRLKLVWPESIFPVLKQWAEQANETYNNTK